jgi:branched-chain amino acid aminotransferase
VIAITIDGELVAEDRATISVLDRGLLYGDGVFEILRTWDGVVVDLDAHLDRLYTSASALQMHALERDKLAGAVHRTVAAAQHGDHRIRIVLTRGPGALAARLAELGRGRAIVIVEPLPEQPAELSLAVVDWPLARRSGAGHKTLAYLDHVLARELARAAGADDALRLDASGDVAECATANLFVVTSGQVATPPVDTGALPGITRGRVLACCAELGVPAVTRRLSIDAVKSAHEVFVTSALRGVVPVTRLDGDPHPAGPITQQLATAYDRMMRRK